MKAGHGLKLALSESSATDGLKHYDCRTVCSASPLFIASFGFLPHIFFILLPFDIFLLFGFFLRLGLFTTEPLYNVNAFHVFQIH